MTKDNSGNKKLNATQKRILEAIENGLAYGALNPQINFEFECINDFCTRNEDGSRQISLVSKKKEEYHVFCYTCGDENKFSKSEFKKEKMRLESEKTKSKSSKLPKREMYIKYLDDEDEEDYPEVA